MNVLILGLGQYPKGSGMAAAMYFARQRGMSVTVYDFYYTKAMDENIAKLKRFKNVRFVLGKHMLSEIKKADLIVKHQRIREDEPEVRAAVKAGKPMDSELSIFLRACPCPVVGITGTRGKSTTTAMIHAILSASKKWRKVWLGGNILVSPLEFLHEITIKDVVVLEMSSFQLEGTGAAGVSPQVAVMTNLFRDHLNAYPSMDEYAEAKAQIFRHQEPNNTVFFPTTADFDQYAKEAPGTVVRVKRGTFKLSIPGEHNQMNASFANAVASKLGVKPNMIKSSLKNFKGLPFRQQVIAVRRGITIINDSTSTMPDATMAALRAQSEQRKAQSQKAQSKTHLLFGGNDKELEFEEVAKLIKKMKPMVYLMPGDADVKIVKAFRDAGVVFTAYGAWREAVVAAWKAAKRGDTILFSPGCTSFGEFKNEFDRGEKFNALIKKYAK